MTEKQRSDLDREYECGYRYLRAGGVVAVLPLFIDAGSLLTPIYLLLGWLLFADGVACHYRASRMERRFERGL